MTPPIPSSSPGFDPEGMDITPLPHKLPQTFVSQITVQSPTPESTPQEEDMISPCSVSPPPNPLSNPLLELPRPAQNGEYVLILPSIPAFILTNNADVARHCLVLH